MSEGGYSSAGGVGQLLEDMAGDDEGNGTVMEVVQSEDGDQMIRIEDNEDNWLKDMQQEQVNMSG